jgi:hypothetical protein
MMWKLILMVGILGQYDDVLDKEAKIERWEPSPKVSVRILEAAIQADQWSSMKAAEIYPDGLRSSFQYNWQRKKINKEFEDAKRLIREAAYKQVMDAYGIDKKTFVKIRYDRAFHKSIRALPFTQEHLQNGPPRGTVRMATYPWWMRPTRFDPESVVLPDKIRRLLKLTH